ncbi:MAG: T9SS type A sorting domain-containing protein, partial [Saprospiraceae bacterium]
QGYTLMKINSTNAIIEKYKYFKESLQNSSIATSSSINYDRGNDKTWSLIKPNGSMENYLVLLENSGLMDHNCSEDLSYTVAKDPIKITDVVFNSKALDLQLADLDCSLNDLELNQQDKCRVTSISNNAIELANVYPNPSSGLIRITSKDKMELIQLLDLNGIILSDFKSGKNQENLDLYLNSGIYYLKIILEGNKSFISKLVIVN